MSLATLLPGLCSRSVIALTSCAWFCINKNWRAPCDGETTKKSKSYAAHCLPLLQGLLVIVSSCFITCNSSLFVYFSYQVPSEAPYIHDWRQDFDARSISFRLESIQERNRGGKILGYKLRYHRFGRSGETVYQDLDVNTEQVTLNNLIPGKVYVISISGYTSAGEGKTRTVSAACKFCNLLRKVLSLSV